MIRKLLNALINAEPDLVSRPFESYWETDFPDGQTFAAKSHVRLVAYRNSQRSESGEDTYRIMVQRSTSDFLSQGPSENIEGELPALEKEIEMPFGFDEDKSYTSEEMRQIFLNWEIVVHDAALDSAMPRSLQTHFNLGNPQRGTKKEDSPFRNRGLPARISRHKLI